MNMVEFPWSRIPVVAAIAAMTFVPLAASLHGVPDYTQIGTACVECNRVRIGVALMCDFMLNSVDEIEWDLRYRFPKVFREAEHRRIRKEMDKATVEYRAPKEKTRR